MRCNSIFAVLLGVIIGCASPRTNGAVSPATHPPSSEVSLPTSADLDATAVMAAAGNGAVEEDHNLPPPPPPDKIPETDKFWTSFVTAFLMILVSELGDKTFLIAAIMAMRHSRILIFLASLWALALMTIISAAFGLLLPSLIPRQWTLWLASLLFAIFGIRMLIEGIQMSREHIREEYDEVSHEIEDSEELARRRELRSPSRSLEAAAAATGGREEEGCVDLPLRRFISLLYSLRMGRLVSPMMIQTFSLTFLAEWGDRSQIATIALAAAQNVYGVAVGAIAGHAVCTAMAVIGGRLLANILSIKTGIPNGKDLLIIYSHHSGRNFIYNLCCICCIIIIGGVKLGELTLSNNNNIIDITDL